MVRSLSAHMLCVGVGFHAVLNVCPHCGAPFRKGPQCGTTAPVDRPEFIHVIDDKIVRCAWHG